MFLPELMTSSVPGTRQGAVLFVRFVMPVRAECRLPLSGTSSSASSMDISATCVGCACVGVSVCWCVCVCVCVLELVCVVYVWRVCVSAITPIVENQHKAKSSRTSPTEPRVPPEEWCMDSTACC